MNHVLDNMVVSGEGRDEWPNKVIAKGLLPLHPRSWNFRYHFISVKRQDEIFVRPVPRQEVFLYEWLGLGYRPANDWYLTPTSEDCLTLIHNFGLVHHGSTRV